MGLKEALEVVIAHLDEIMSAEPNQGVADASNLLETIKEGLK